MKYKITIGITNDELVFSGLTEEEVETILENIGDEEKKFIGFNKNTTFTLIQKNNITFVEGEKINE